MKQTLEELANKSSFMTFESGQENPEVVPCIDFPMLNPGKIEDIQKKPLKGSAPLWTEEELARLDEGFAKFGPDYKRIAEFVGTRSEKSCMSKISQRLKSNKNKPK
jgi:hypothetical protein